MMDPEQSKRSKEFPYPKYILPFLKYFNWLQLTPTSIKYDDKSNSFVYIEGSLLKRVASLIILFSQLTYIIWGTFLRPIENTVPIGKILHRFTFLAFIVYQSVWSYLLLTKFSQIPAVFNKCKLIFNTVVLRRNGEEEHLFTSLSFSRRILNHGWLPFALTLFLAYVTAINYLVQHMTTATNGPCLLDTINQIVNNTALSFCQVGQFWCDQFDRDNGQPLVSAYVIGTIWIALQLTTETTWIIFQGMVTCWGFYFRRLFKHSVEKIKLANSDKEILIATKHFVQATMLLNNWNEIFGGVILTSVMETILYVTVVLGTTMAQSSLAWASLGNILTYLSFLPSVLMLLSMAEVHKLSLSVPDILKEKSIRDSRWNQGSESMPMALLNRTVIIHHDVQSNNIGFKGLHFFTMSYGFLGNIAGIIATYTVVTIQLASSN